MTTVRYMQVIAAARDTVTKMLAQRTSGIYFSVQVTTLGGKTASVRRNAYQVSMNLPSLPPDTVLTRNEADRMLAYMAHEVCHALHTDWAVWTDAVRAGERVKHWTNALEDVRIEAHEIATGPYSALRGLLSTLVTHLYTEAHTALAKKKQKLGEDLYNAPYIFTVLGRAANGYDLPTTRPLTGQLSATLRPIIARALDGIKTCTSTRDCLTLACELVAMEQALTQPAPPRPGQPGQPQPKQPGPKQPGPKQPPKSTEGDDTEGEGEGDDAEGDDAEGDDAEGEDDDAEGDNTEGDNTEGDNTEGEGDDAKGNDTEGEGDGSEGNDTEGDSDNTEGESTKSESTGSPNAQGNPGKGNPNKRSQKHIEPDLNLGDTAKDIIERTGDLDKTDESHRLNTMTAQHSKPRTASDTGNKQAANSFSQTVPVSGILHEQIARLLVSEARTTRTHHETTGRLDRRALTRIQTGATDVFSRRDFAPGIDTAVMLLIDCSGSMGGTMYLATATAWAIARAAESANGKLAIAGFQGNGAHAELNVVKDWTQSTEQAAFGLMTLSCGGSTPLSASIIAASQDLAAVQATRRILMVLTDGMCDLNEKAIKSACRIASALDVEAVGIGIACPSVVKAFPERYSTNVNNLNQLATTGLGTLVRMLEETGEQRR